MNFFPFPFFIFLGIAWVILYLLSATAAAVFAHMLHVDFETAKEVFQIVIPLFACFTLVVLFFKDMALSAIKWLSPLAAVCFLLAFRPIFFYWGTHDWTYPEVEAGNSASWFFASSAWVNTLCFLPALGYVYLYFATDK